MESASTEEITALLRAHRQGDGGAFDQLVALVYPRLRQLAHGQLRKARPGHTLNTTALVHETYLRLARGSAMDLEDRAHFYGVAARAMRQVIVDYARRVQAKKRGGGQRRLTLDDNLADVDDQAEMVLLLDEALTKLGELNERLARVVECRFFIGWNEKETAKALSLSRATVQRDWLKAKASLRQAMQSA